MTHLWPEWLELFDARRETHLGLERAVDGIVVHGVSVAFEHEPKTSDCTL